MTELQKGILEVILKSNLKIENAVIDKLKSIHLKYPSTNISDLMIISTVKVLEISRQINELSSSY